MRLRDFLPQNVAVVPLMPREQVAHALACYVRALETQTNQRGHFGNICGDLAAEFPGEDVTAAQSAFRDAWALLNSQAMLGPSPTHGTSFVVLTTSGREFAASSDPSRYVRAALLPRDGLDPGLVAKVERHFVAQDYDEAVEAAFQEVEIRWKAAGKGRLDRATSTGLASDAFDPRSGPLADGRLPSTVRTGIRNFAVGAMASIRTVFEHNYPKLEDRGEALELVYVASLLIRLGERGASAPRPQAGS